MIYLERPAPPIHLLDSGITQKWNTEIVQWAKRAVERQQLTLPEIKFPFQERDFGLELEKSLRITFAQKCVYCESVQEDTNSNFQLLYYRPFPNEANVKNWQKTLHYFWLAWQWPNMYLACPTCYEHYMNNGRPFPVKNLRAQPAMCQSYQELFHVAWLNETEKPLILDPCYDKPGQHIQYILKENSVELKGISERGEVTISVLKLNRKQLGYARRKEANHFEQHVRAIWQKASSGKLSQADINKLIDKCEPNVPFAGLKRYILQQQLYEHQLETLGNEWEIVRDQLRQWQEETAVAPKPFPLPSITITQEPPPPPPSLEFPFVRWKVTGIEDTERKHCVLLLKALNPSFREVTVTREFGAGFSGAKVFLVTRKNMSGELLSPIVVKFDTLNSLQEEVANYKGYINGRFTKCVSLEFDIIELPNVPYACIAYQLAGGGKFDVESIKSFWWECSNIQAALNALNTIGADWKDVWIEGETRRNYSLLSYDWLLPPNFIVEVETASSGFDDRKLIRPDDIFELLNISEYLEASVCIQPTTSESLSFIVREVNGNEGEVTLDLPQNQTDKFRIRLCNIENIKQFKIGETISTPIYGRIINDRITFLKKIVANVFDHTLVGLDKNQITFPGLENFPLENPLHQLPNILKIDLPSAKVSIVHGDMNLENILIRTDAQGYDISVIDFGKTKKAHNIHDLLRLETSVWLYLISLQLPNLTPGDRHALIWQIKGIYSIFKSVHERGAEENFNNSEIDLSIPCAILREIRHYAFDIMEGATEQKYKNYYLGLCLYMLGALKFKNLDSPENNAPIPRQVAFQLACLAFHTAENGEIEAWRDSDNEDQIDSERVPKVQPKVQHSEKYLHDELAKFFNLDELAKLCYEIDIVYEHLSGENAERKAIELVQYCKRHDKTATLIEHCKRERPSRDWHNLQL